VTSPDTPYDPNLTAGSVDETDWEDAPIVPRARMPWPTKLLLVVVLAAAAFAGGIFAQRHWGKTASSATGASAAAAASRFAGAAGSGAVRRFRGAATGTAAGADAFGGATVGQVSYLRGNTLYVTTNGGNTVKVAVPKGTPVTTSVTTTVRAVRPGDTVVVRGSAGRGGTVTAQSVSIGGAGGGFGGGGTGFGGGGAATGFGGGGQSGSGAPTGFGGG
jgi:hypothetical protein